MVFQIYSTSCTIYRILNLFQPQCHLFFQCREAKIAGPYSDKKKNQYNTTSQNIATVKLACAASPTASLQFPLRETFCHSSSTCSGHMGKWDFLIPFTLNWEFSSFVVRFLINNAAPCLVSPPLFSEHHPHYKTHGIYHMDRPGT